MSKIKKTKTKRSKKRKVLSQSEKETLKEKRLHIAQVRSIFIKAGFYKVSDFADVPIKFKEREGDFDDAFIYKNIYVLVEYTTSKTENISNHLLKKKVLYDHILDNDVEFLEYLFDKFSSFKKFFKADNFTKDEIKLFIIYCSKNEIDNAHKSQVSRILYLDFYAVKYFKSLTDILKTSARFELFKFLNLHYTDIGENISPSKSSLQYKGSLLPHSYSNFTEGYKILSFYMDPRTLIERSYVLRKYGWLDNHGLYQRMISARKISQIREYLNIEERVFINNIIVTLPDQTKLLDENNNTVDFSKIKRTEPVEIQLPEEYNIIGLIDGQHRVYAYHEGGLYDDKIAKLRVKQNLLVTGIMYPPGITDEEKVKFEARLFLEINSTQANAKSDLKQAIGLILKPFNLASISRAVLEGINKNGPLQKLFEVHFFDKGKLKTTSVVSYGLSPLIKLGGSDSLFTLFPSQKRKKLADKTNETLLKEYISFCVEKINEFLLAVKIELSKSNKWCIASKKDLNSILNTTTINGFLICLRRLIENNKIADKSYYEKQLSDLGEIDFLSYKSSQYGDLGNEIFKRFFS